MLGLFTASKKRLEQRMLTLCSNTQKPEAMVAMNLLGQPAALVQPVAKLDDGQPALLNTLDRGGPPPGAQVLPVARKKRRSTPLSF